MQQFIITYFLNVQNDSLLIDFNSVDVYHTLTRRPKFE